MKDFYPYIEAYHQDRLSPERRKVFEQQMAEDALLKDAVTQYPVLVPVVDHLLEEDIRTSLAEIKAIARPEDKQSRAFSLGRRLAIAASVLVLIGALGWMWSSRPATGEKLFMAYYQRPPSPTVRGAETTVADNEKLYQDAHQAITNGQIEKGRELLNSLQVPDQEWQAEIEWYLILLSLKENKLEQAKSEISAMLKAGGKGYGVKLQELLAELD